ncbi:MAG: hypothetical protein KGL44_13025 [Sphingomonadales bacterium]|nr:hypothetical protein [Sphingomonadales bacterium]
MRRLWLLGLAAVPVVGWAQTPPAPPPPVPMPEVIAAFADGPERLTVATACCACHAPGIITGKRFDGDKWGQVVDQMIDKGARVNDADYDTIVGYLARNYGAQTK